MTAQPEPRPLVGQAAASAATTVMGLTFTGIYGRR